MSATSKSQDSLPTTSDELLQQLNDWGLGITSYEHEPIHTVAEAKTVQSEFLTLENGGGHVKNLYLRDHKKRNFLVVAEQDSAVNLKALPETISSGRLSFGSADRLFEHLGVRPGAVTPFAMITGVTTGVEVFLDETLKSCKLVYAHPLVNDRTVEITPDNLERFFEIIGCPFTWITLPDAH